MGGWTLQLFCCDYDLDLIHQFDKDCGLIALEVEQGKNRSCNVNTRRQAEHKIWREKNEGRPVSNTASVSYSMFEKLCSDPEKVRSHLDSTSALDKRFAALRKEAQNAERFLIDNPYGPCYKLCILGACAMTLGAKISDVDREAMCKYHKNCALMRDAVTQLADALDRDTGYVSCWIYRPILPLQN